MQRLSQAIREARPGAIVSISPNYYDFAYKLQLQDWRRWVQEGVADELLIQIYRPDLASYLPQLNKPEVQEAQSRIPTAIAVLSGQRNRPTTMELIRQKVQALFPAHEHDEFTELFWTRIQSWREQEGRHGDKDGF